MEKMISPEGTVLATGLGFPEGPAFAPDGTLWWVELDGGCITRLGEAGPVRLDVGGKPNGLVFGPDGEILFCDAEANSIRRLDPVDSSTSIYVAPALMRRYSTDPTTLPSIAMADWFSPALAIHGPILLGVSDRRGPAKRLGSWPRVSTSQTG
ncbi:MAG: SMP-30/gluconolactonase/LRE family protein [Cypionkella sp.]